MTVILDTHAWVWWAAEDRRLSRRAAQVIQRAVRGDGVAISMMSVWEVAKKFEKQQLVFDRPLRDWLTRATALPGLSLLELTPAILVGSCELPQPFHGDPADQIIVATARHHHATLVSKDARLTGYAHVQTVW